MIKQRTSNIRSRRSLGYLWIFLLSVLSPCILHAQQERGAVSGTVKDPSGAIVTNAAVTATNTQTQNIFKTKTNDQGLYSILFLPIGAYDLSISASGFQTAVQHFELHGNDHLQIDLALHVGSTSEMVTVRSEVPLLEAETGDSGMTISAEQIQNLPLLGRNPFMLATMTPGVIVQPGQPANISQRPFDNGGFDYIMVNGGRGFTTEVTMDGLADTGSEQASAGQISNINFVPSPDMTSEFRVQSSVYDAQYGRSGGGFMAFNLKSGTNELHGAAYEYYRSQVLNANDYADDKAGNPKSGFHWNQPGVVIDGPVYIPKLYDGRNKTFFMFGWEDIRTTTPEPTYSTVPTALEKQGNFSQSLAGNQPAILYDPLTTVQHPDGSYSRTAFGSSLPTGRIDPVASKIISLLPDPNAYISGNGDSNDLFAGPNNTLDVYNAYTARIDHTINPAHRIDVVYLYSHRQQTSGTNGYPVAITPNYQHYRINNGAHVNWDWVISPTLVSSFGVGWIEHRFAILNQQPVYDLSTLGFPSYMSDSPAPTLFPQINMAGYSSFGNSGYGTGALNTDDNYDLRETLVKTLKRHNLSFGGEDRAMRDDYNYYAGYSSLSSGRDFTQANPLASDNVSGNSVASFLLGYADGGGISTNPRVGWRDGYYALFAQDSWRVTDHLTLTLGLRWDTESPMTEAHGQANTGFNPNASYSFAGQALKGQVLFGKGDPYNWNRSNFGPRFGFSYAATKNLLVRGGLGMLYSPTFDNSSDVGFSANTNYLASTNNLLTPALPTVVSNPYPSGFVQPGGASSNLNGQGGWQYWDNNTRNIPRITQYSLGIEYELPFRSILDVHYVGQLTTRLPNYRNPNFTSVADLALGNQLNTQLPNPFAGLLPGTSLNSATWSLQQSLLPYPQYGSFTEVVTNGSINYNGLQMRYEKRVSHGLSFLVGYTYQKPIDTGYLNDQDTVQAHYVDGNDLPQVLTISGSYSLPFFSNSKNRVEKQAFGGWAVNLIARKSSGQIYGAPGGVQATGVNPHVAHPTWAHAFNTCTITTSGTLQNCSASEPTPVWAITPPFTLNRMIPTYGGFRSPIPWTEDASIFKTFPIHDRLNLQFRAEFFNLTNTPVFPGPDTNVNDATFGQQTVFTQTNIPRNIQVALKLTF
ncbi:carboxypeptidase regulatory-like domain-containing protein [Granulicella sp. S156]|uniref:carboxypeptidase regulatory-like domain-containing protein n=1 Tax=Granulicella sp. S156 TaxID=1747224 RepID=UPI00131C657A|nr:carboxypeptidase regulatory-like domain-containing protein [Granulicella sp. S156]